MSIRATLRGGNARHPVGSIFLAFLRNRGSRSQFLFACAKVAAPLALVVGLVVAGSGQRGPSPIASLAEAGSWGSAPPAPVVAIAERVATDPLPVMADSGRPVVPRGVIVE